MPREFSAIHTAQAWAPLSPSGPLAELMETRTSLWLDVIGMVEQGVAVESAHAEMSAIMGRLARQYPGIYDGQGILLEPLKETVVGDARSTLLRHRVIAAS